MYVNAMLPALKSNKHKTIPHPHRHMDSKDRHTFIKLPITDAHTNVERHTCTVDSFYTLHVYLGHKQTLSISDMKTCLRSLLESALLAVYGAEGFDLWTWLWQTQPALRPCDTGSVWSGLAPFTTLFWC